MISVLSAVAENMRQFIAAWESGEHAESLVFQVFNIGGLNLLEIVADEGNVSVEQTYYVFQDNRLTQTAHSEFQADYCE